MQLSWHRLLDVHVITMSAVLCCAALSCIAEGEVPLEWNSGTNAYVYMVCNYLGGPLTQLPHVTPDQV